MRSFLEEIRRFAPCAEPLIWEAFGLDAPCLEITTDGSVVAVDPILNAAVVSSHQALTWAEDLLRGTPSTPYRSQRVSIWDTVDGAPVRRKLVEPETWIGIDGRDGYRERFRALGYRESPPLRQTAATPSA